MEISKPTTLEPRLYAKSESTVGDGPIVEIRSDGVELDLAGAVIDGEDFTGPGIYVRDCQNVTIKNGIIKGCYYGIRAERLKNLRVENCVVSDNHNPKDVGWLSDTADPNEKGFGGGIYLFQVSNSVIEGNIVNGNFNGIDLIRSDGNHIVDNDASHSANVGIHLLASTNNTIERNRADHCIRYTGRFRSDTADSAGILLEEYSHHNKIIGNSLRYSGDGFFIRANNRHSSDHNYVANNNASFSPNNAFEAVFSSHNVFEDNIADYSNYGFWLGYSRHTTVRRNKIRSCRFDGIAIEHGSHNHLEENEISGSRYGIRLWWEPSPNGDDLSEAYVIEDNRISQARECGILLADTHDVLLSENVFDHNRKDVEEIHTHAAHNFDQTR